MRHQRKTLKLGRDRDHRRALLRNLATSLILYEKIKTTQAKAKAVKPLIDKVINSAKETDKQKAIRELQTILFDANASKKAIDKLAGRYQDRTSGYTRIINLGQRNGDHAPIVQIELV